MASPLHHLAEIVSYARTRGEHDRADKADLADLTVGAEQLGLPPLVDVRWLGVAGFAISDEGTTILIDPCVTRRPLADLLRRKVVTADPVLLDRYVPRPTPS